MTSAPSYREHGGSPEKVAVMVAPVAHQGSFLPPGCHNPLTPEEVAAETVRCAEAGAALVHHHVRNPEGVIVSDLRWYRETLDLIRSRTDILLNVSTGGVSELSLEERCVGLDEPRVQFASLNMGSVNFGESVYINSLPDIRFWASRMRERGVIPELEVFGPGMIETVWKLRDEGILREPLHYNFCLGFPSSLQATAHNLANLVSMIPEDSIWGFIHEGAPDLRLTAAALGMGATVLRVGYEDSGYLRPGVAADSNARLVEALVAMIRAAGLEVAGVEEAKVLLRMEAHTHSSQEPGHGPA